MAVVQAVSELVLTSREVRANSTAAEPAPAPGGAAEGGAAAQPEDVGEVVVAAAALVDAVITAADSVDEGTAVVATSVISELVGELAGQLVERAARSV